MSFIITLVMNFEKYHDAFRIQVIQLQFHQVSIIIQLQVSSFIHIPIQIMFFLSSIIHIVSSVFKVQFNLQVFIIYLN